MISFHRILFCLTLLLVSCGPGVLTGSSGEGSLGVFGRALKFTSTSNQAASFTHANLTFNNNSGGGLTIEARIRLDTSPTANAFIFQIDGPTHLSPKLYINSSRQVVLAAPSAAGCNTTSSTLTSNSILQVGVSYHIAATALKNSAAGSVIFINGIQDNVDAVSPPATTSCSSITSSRIGNSVFLNEGFPGVIDEVRVSNSERYPGSFTPSGVPFIPDSTTQILFHADSLVYTGFLNANESPGGVTPLSFTVISGATYTHSPFP